MAEHEWVPSTLGHGEMMCKHCLMTNREAWVLGAECSCNVTCTLPEPTVNVVQNTPSPPPIEQALNERLAEVKTLTFSDAPYERPQGEIRCEDGAEGQFYATKRVTDAVYNAETGVIEDVRGDAPRNEPETAPVTLDDVTHVLSRVEVLLDTWELLICGNAVIKTNDHTVEMTSLAMDVITCLRDELIAMADNMRGNDDAEV